MSVQLDVKSKMRDHERWFAASVQHFTLCSMLLESYFLETVIVLRLHLWKTTV